MKICCKGMIMSDVKLLMQLIPDDIQDLIISIGVSISSDKWRLGGFDERD